MAPGTEKSRADDARGPAQGKHRWRSAGLGAQAPARPLRAAQDPDDDFRRRAGRRFHAVGQPRQLSGAASAPYHRGNRDPLAGRTDRDRHRSRRHALLSPRGYHRGCRRTRRRHHRKARRAVQRDPGCRARQDRPQERPQTQIAFLRPLERDDSSRTPAQLFAMTGEPSRDRSRRGFLTSMAAGLSMIALPVVARAQHATQPPPKPARPEEFAVTEATSIEVNARPIPSFDPDDHAHTRFGALEYRSGLVLTSRFPGFGGLSGLRLDPKGERFISFSDKGSWFTGKIIYNGREMTGLTDVEAAPMLGSDGEPITTHRGWYDSESIGLDGSFVYIGLEGVNQVLRFDFGKGFTRSRGEVVPLPAAASKLPSNKGLEALVFVPKGMPLAGTLIAISERGLDAKGNLIAFLVGGPSPGQFSVRRTEKFDVSDAVLLPSGNLLVLERKFSLLSGVGIRIRRIALASVVPGAVVDVPTIFNADLGNEVDNMEGIDAHITPEGDTVLTMISDDNFSMIQRTLLLQFTLVE